MGKNRTRYLAAPAETGAKSSTVTAAVTAVVIAAVTAMATVIVTRRIVVAAATAEIGRAHV